LNHSELQKVIPALLKTEAHQMLSLCFWRNSHYWSSRPSSKTRDSDSVVIRIAYFKTVNWVGFNFCKYHPDAVEVLRKLPKSDRLFYEFKPNCYASFKVWCVDSQHFEKIISLFNNYPDIELEFIISSPHQIPELFQPLNLTFYERRGLGRLGENYFLMTLLFFCSVLLLPLPQFPLLSLLSFPPATPAPPAPPAFFGGGLC
jgi:hypothetical protein